MKKIVGIIAALALAGAVFADAPAIGLAESEFTGNASIEWIYNLESEEFGMKNASEASFKVKLVGEGTKETSGDGLWGELQIKAGSWEVKYGDGAKIANFGKAKFKKGDGTEKVVDLADAQDPTAGYKDGGNDWDPVENGFPATPEEWPYMESVATVPGGAEVKVAKIHFVDGDFYLVMDITKPSFEIGALDLALATKGNLGNSKPKVELADQAGFTLNLGLTDIFDANIKFADNGVKKSGDKEFAFGAEATLKAVENLDLYGGFAYDTVNEKAIFGARASYKIGISDTMYVKPGVGFSMDKDEKKSLAAGVLFGWGSEGQEPGFKGFSNGVKNVENKCSDGVSFAIKTDLEDNTGIDLMIGAYDSTMIAGLADALAGLKVGVQFVANAKTISDAWSLDAAAAYSNTFGIFKFGANFGFKALKLGDDTETGILWGASVETDEIIQNTTLYVKYTDGEKAEKIGGADKKGKITVGAKIHF